jgi:hypothetical protein
VAGHSITNEVRPPNRRWTALLLDACQPVVVVAWSYLQSRTDGAHRPLLPQTRDNESLRNLMVVAMVSGMAALFAFWLCGRLRISPGDSVFWILVVLLTNVSGLIAFRFSPVWPVRVKCPSCGRLRSLRREACEHCGSTWPTPAATGAEILEPSLR